MWVQILTLVLSASYSSGQSVSAEDLDHLRTETRSTIEREAAGYHNHLYGKYFNRLQSKFEKPDGDHDFLIDPYTLLGAQRAILGRAMIQQVGRARTASRFGSSFPTSMYSLFRTMLNKAFTSKLDLPPDEADALALGIVNDSRRTAKVPELRPPSMARVRQAAQRLFSTCKIVHSCQVPFIAGYDHTGSRIYIDRDVADRLRVHGHFISVVPLLVVRERVEKALMDAYQLKYQHAHQIALRTERLAARALHVSWKDYDGYMTSMIPVLEHRPVQWVPRELDQTSYLSYDDDASLKLLSDLRSAIVDENQCPATLNRLNL